MTILKKFLICHHHGHQSCLLTVISLLMELQMVKRPSFTKNVKWTTTLNVNKLMDLSRD